MAQGDGGKEPLSISYSGAYKKDLKRCAKRGLDLGELDEVVETLATPLPLSQEYLDHSLHGNYDGYRECHIKPDWLLIYKVSGKRLFLHRTGTHSELFNE